jgi:hypothetical protein
MKPNVPMTINLASDPFRRERADNLLLSRPALRLVALFAAWPSSSA